MKNFVFLFLILSGWAMKLNGQDAALLIDGVNKKFAKVKDYQADALIDTKITFLKILPQKAVIYYRNPGKFKVKAEGIAILPKQDFDQLFELLANPKAYSAFVTGTEEVRNTTLIIVQVLPSSDSSDLVVAKLWIDPERDLILKSQLTTRSNGTVLINYRFGKYESFALPDQIMFTIEIKKFKIPKAVSADLNSTSKTSTGKESKTGQIIIYLENYKINKGIDPSVFK